MTKKLTKAEFYKLQWYNERAERLKLEQDIMRQQIKIKQLNRAILQYRIKDEDIEISALDIECKHLQTRATEFKSEQNKELDRVRKRLNLEGRFGYDEETLEVIED